MKQKCIIFGASKYGEIAYRALGGQYEVILFRTKSTHMGINYNIINQINIIL